MYNIYLIECIDNDRIGYKIGYTKRNVKTRLKELQTGSRYKLSIIDIYESKYGSKLEKTLHNYFSHKNTLNEWFDLDLEDLSIFKDICKKIENNFDILYEENYHFKKIIKK